MKRVSAKATFSERAKLFFAGMRLQSADGQRGMMAERERIKRLIVEMDEATGDAWGPYWAGFSTACEEIIARIDAK